MSVGDRTHAPDLTSWVPTANGHPDFPIQNLPMGVFTPAAGGTPRIGAAIGDFAVDLASLAKRGAFIDEIGASLQYPTLNRWLALSQPLRSAFRGRLSSLLAADHGRRQDIEAHLLRRDAIEMQLPATIGDYTDYYAGIHHAENVGRLLHPDSPLPPNYRYMPLAYHGRASSVRPSGDPVCRPLGQYKPRNAIAPLFGPSRRLDYEVELGIWIGGAENVLGFPVPIEKAPERIAGLCLLNDWSARDVQGWEAQPLGPFLSKSFITSISPWLVTNEALIPFRQPVEPRPSGDPLPLPYLWNEGDQAEGSFRITLQSSISTAAMRAAAIPPHPLGRIAASCLYWTPAQMIAHHTANGCNLRPADLLGTGTISAPTAGGFGSLLEMSEGGRKAILLPTGEERRFLEDEDEVILTGQATADGCITIGFGECRGRVKNTFI